MAPKRKGSRKITSSTPKVPQRKPTVVAVKKEESTAKPPAEHAPPPEPEPQPPVVVEPEPQTGKVRVQYSHYDKQFPIKDGLLKWEDIDDEYCISFAFKGDWAVSLSTKWPDGSQTFIYPDGGVLTRDTDEDSFTGTFKGLLLEEGEGEEVRQRVYQLHVEEDPKLARAEMKRQKEAFEARKGAAGPLAGGGSNDHSILGPSMAQSRLTAELKSMSADELAEGGERYKQLLEARELEACMQEGMM